MKVAVQLVTWNGEKYIKPLFESLKIQTFAEWELLVLDNGSTDNTLKLIETERKQLTNPVRIIQKNENTGFAPAHEELRQANVAEYFLVLNQDVELEPTMLEVLVRELDSHQEVASIAPRLMRTDEGIKTDIVDSLGLVIKKTRAVSDGRTGEEWQKIQNKYGDTISVFGVSGACALYRRRAIDVIGFYDTSYFAYKEDVDLAWRLQLGGFKSVVKTDAVAYHVRSGRLGSVVEKKNQSRLVLYRSYKNHLVTVYKNEQWQNFWFDFGWIVGYECLKFVYALFVSQVARQTIGELFKERRELRSKRKSVQQNTRVSWSEIRKWFK